MRRIIIFTLITGLTVCQFPAALSAGVSEFRDVAGHWARAHLTKMIEAGVIAGDGKGNVMPDRSIRVDEAAIMLSKAFSLNLLDLEDAVTGNYSDITAESRYVQEHINNIIAAGYMTGENGRFEPRRLVSREEAFAIIRNAFKLPDAPKNFISRFSDFNDVSGDAKDHVLSMEYAGMISGNNGRISPHNTVTRAEFATLLSKCAGEFIGTDTDFINAELPRAVIHKPGLTVLNLTAEYLTIAQGAGNGSVTVENCDAGTVFVYGGGTLTFINSSVTELIIGTALTGDICIIIDEGSIVETVTIHSGDVTIEGDILFEGTND